MTRVANGRRNLVLGWGTVTVAIACLALAEPVPALRRRGAAWPAAADRPAGEAEDYAGDEPADVGHVRDAAGRFVGRRDGPEAADELEHRPDPDGHDCGHKHRPEAD